MVQLQRPTAAPASPGAGRWALPALDDAQAAAVAHRGGRAAVIGAPGTGKTVVAIGAVLSRVAEGLAPEGVLVLSASRVAAARLRDRISGALGATSTQPAARTASSLAYGLLRRRAALAGAEPPRLLSGPEQDAILRELLAGHAAEAAPGPGWPAPLSAALNTRGFRAELRDLLMRAAERGLAPAELAALGRTHDRPEWVAAARVAEEYDEVTALALPGGLDPAALLAAAADAVAADPTLVTEALPALSAVIVDDAQELTPPGARLVAELTSGADLLVIGDPDAATQAFRGADPRLFLDLAGAGAVHVLPRRWRQGPPLAAATARVAARIGAVGEVRHRSAGPGPAAAEQGVEVLLARSPAQEARHVAEELRRQHLVAGVPWSRMAVIVRGRSRTAILRRVLSAERVPIVLPGAHVPLRDEPVVAALLGLLRSAVRLAGGPPPAGQAPPLAAGELMDLLASPVGGLDAIGMRRLRRALRGVDLAGAPEGAPVRSVDQALVEAVLGDGTLDRLGPEGAAARRLARALAAGAAAARHESGRWAPGVTAETVLWAIWSALDVAEPWRRAALEGGPAGSRADRDLDAVVALFESAASYVDRLPGRGPDGFIEHVRGQDVAGDLLAEAAPTAESVTVTTPAGAAGSEWDVVAVCGVQEGVWPDLRLRGSVLGSQAIVDLLAGRSTSPRQALTAVRHDEARLFHVAVSRARRRVLVTATANEDEQPSPYLDLVDGGPPPTADARPVRAAPERMSPQAAVARLRRELVGAPDEDRAAAAARRLALLAAEGVPGAHPDEWWGLLALSDDRPRRPAEAPVQVSPSRLESFQHCPLRWLLSAAGGDRPRPGGADAVGTLVHAIAAEVDNGDVAALHAELDARWPSLGLPPGWLAERARGQAREMLARLARYDALARSQGWQVIGREVAVDAALGRAQVRGRLDRVERDPQGRLRVVDLKTGSTKPREDDLARHPQLGAYQVLVGAGDLGEEPAASGGAALLQLGRGSAASRVDLQVQRPLTEDAEPDWAQRLLSDTAAGMAAPTFAARAGDWCRTCSTSSCCPASPDGDVI